MTTHDELMRANLLEVFGERDHVVRASAAARIYTEDVVFSDPDEVVIGLDALSAKAQRILDEAPGFVFSEVGPVRSNHDLAQLAWGFGPPGQAPVVNGVDICFFQDGRIAKVYTLLT